MATPEEIEQAVIGATKSMQDLGYEVREMPRHNERGIGLLLASNGKEQRLVCAVNKNNHPNDWAVPGAFAAFVETLRSNSGLFPLMRGFDIHYDLVITWFIESDHDSFYASMRIADCM